MCGINGIITREMDQDQVQYRLHEGMQAQIHRGPDFQKQILESLGSYWIGFAHQRLSILDLSELGNQPMYHPSGRGVLIYNGEIYNYKEIKQELQLLGIHFQGDSDTEVLLHALANWELETVLNKLNGMWAFAWYDFDRKRLILARDRLGVKPLHFYKTANTFYFASEIKSILHMVDHKFRVNQEKVAHFLRQSLLETDESTFFEGIEKVPSGHYALFDLTNPSLQFTLYPYWRLQNSISSIEIDEAILRTRNLFYDAVKLRLRSDVPVGVLLSGGVDSSSIAGVVNQLASNCTYLSSVSDDARYDESVYIDKMGAYLGKPIQKVALTQDPHAIFKALEQVTWHNEQPVGSLSNVAHYLLMEKAKELGITVLLTGQGADELLCGYKKYVGFYLQSLLKQKEYGAFTKTLWSFYKNKTVLNQFTFAEAKRYLPSWTQKNESVLLGEVLQEYLPLNVGLVGTVQDRQVQDLTRFSVPILTHYEDRMSMAFAREMRVPFLDYRLVRHLISMPTSFHLQQGWTKYIFRKAMEPYVPKEIIWRKDKQSFVNPQEQWLKKELRTNVYDLLHANSFVVKNGWVNLEAFKKTYDVYVKQKAKHGRIWYKNIFDPIALEMWMHQYQNFLI